MGNRKNVEAIVGGTVAWNQLANPSSISATATVNNVTFTNNGDGSVTVSGMASAITYFNIVGEKTWTAHKYLLRGCPSGGSLTTYSLMFRGQASPVIDMGNGVLWDASTYRYKAVQICVNQNAAISTPITFKPQVFDLTAMFGTAIADYAYSLEQATAGSGIAWLKSYGFFTEDYYAYDAGSLQSVEATSHVTVGKNAFDIDRTLDVPSPSDLLASPRVMSTDKFYVGLRADNYYYRNYIANYSVSDGVIKVTTGTNNSYGLGFPVKCEPDTQYTLSCDKNNANMSVGCYDADWNYISRLVSLTSDESATFTTPSNAEYITLIFSSLILMEEGTITNIQLECGSSATTYEPYVKHTYPLDSDLVLRGIPKLNNGNLYYDGDTYEWDGTVTRKYAEVDLGTLTWYYNSANAYFYAKLTEAKGVPNARTAANMICDKYINHEWTGLSDKQISRFYASQDGINVKDSSYTDAATFKTAMSGHYLVFELADAYQTTESADPFVELQVVDPDGTEEYIDYGVAQGTRDYAVPVGHKTRYFTVPEIF